MPVISPPSSYFSYPHERMAHSFMGISSKRKKENARRIDERGSGSHENDSPVPVVAVKKEEKAGLMQHS